MKAAYFATPAEFGRWLRKHHAAESEILVGFHKRDSEKPSMTWPQSVDEALCLAWIDGVRRRVDDRRYTIRFTPRKTGSIWSAVNVRRVEGLTPRAARSCRSPGTRSTARAATWPRTSRATAGTSARIGRGRIGRRSDGPVKISGADRFEAIELTR